MIIDENIISARVNLAEMVQDAASGGSSSNVKGKSYSVDPENKEIKFNNGPYSEVIIDYNSINDVNKIDITKEDILGNNSIIENNDNVVAFRNIAQEHVEVKDLTLNISKVNDGVKVEYIDELVNKESI